MRSIFLTALSNKARHKHDQLFISVVRSGTYINRVNKSVPYIIAGTWLLDVNLLLGRIIQDVTSNSKFTINTINARSLLNTVLGVCSSY